MILRLILYNIITSIGFSLIKCLNLIRDVIIFNLITTIY